MKKHIRFITLMLALTLAASLTSCWLLEEPFGEEDNATETGSSILIDPDKTQPPKTDVFPTVPVETAPATEPTSDIRYKSGIVVEYPYEEPMENVLAIRVYQAGEKTMFVYTDRAADFCVGDEVGFSYDANAEPMDSYDGVSVWVLIEIEAMQEMVAEKPVIYLYPETPTEVSVKLTIDGKLTCTYPAYGNGWDDLTAHPDGTLIFPDGKEYYCLYWEGIQNTEWDFTEGFCVKGTDTAAFLEWALAEQGLTPREANEFIIYWLPRMERNPYNVIAFQTDAYTDGAVLDISPAPDSLLRVFMAYYPSDVAVEMEAQTFEGFERHGFTVVEWGGCELACP